MKGKNDFKQFAKLMSVMTGIFEAKQEMKPFRVELYFKVLEDLSIEQIEKSVNQLMHERVYSTMPLPAHIRQNVQSTRLLDSLEAWSSAVKWFEGGPQPIDPITNKVVGILGGYEKVSRTPYPQLPWIQKDFERLYKDLSERRDVHELPAPQGKELKLLK